jgi:hypothetical protein
LVLLLWKWSFSLHYWLLNSVCLSLVSFSGSLRFFGEAVLGMEFKTLPMLDKQSVTWATPQPFCLRLFS